VPTTLFERLKIQLLVSIIYLIETESKWLKKTNQYYFQLLRRWSPVQGKTLPFGVIEVKEGADKKVNRPIGVFSVQILWIIYQLIEHVKANILVPISWDFHWILKIKSCQQSTAFLGIFYKNQACHCGLYFTIIGAPEMWLIVSIR